MPLSDDRDHQSRPFIGSCSRLHASGQGYRLIFEIQVAYIKDGTLPVGPSTAGSVPPIRRRPVLNLCNACYTSPSTSIPNHRSWFCVRSTCHEGWFCKSPPFTTFPLNSWYLFHANRKLCKEIPESAQLLSLL